MNDGRYTQPDERSVSRSQIDGFCSSYSIAAGEVFARPRSRAPIVVDRLNRPSVVWADKIQSSRRRVDRPSCTGNWKIRTPAPVTGKSFRWDSTAATRRNDPARFGKGLADSEIAGWRSAEVHGEAWRFVASKMKFSSRAPFDNGPPSENFG